MILTALPQIVEELAEQTLLPRSTPPLLENAFLSKKKFPAVLLPAPVTPAKTMV